MKILFEYLFKFRTLSIARIFTNIFKAGCSVLLSIILGNVLDGLTSADMGILSTSVLHCVILIFSFITISIIDTLVTTLQTKKLMNYIKHDIFSRILNGSIEKYQSMHSGNYISILNNDISIIKSEFIENFFDLIFQTLAFSISIVILLRINIVVTFIICGISAVGLFTVSKVSKRLMEQQTEFSESLEGITKLASEIFAGFQVIKNYDITNKMEEMYYKSDEVVEENRKRYTVIIGAINIIMVCFSLLTYLIIILFCANSVMNATLSAGAALIIIQLSSNLTDPINEITSIISSMHSVKGIGEKIENLRSGEELIKTTTIHKEVYYDSVIMKNVTFCYESEVPILNNLDLCIEKGKKYAIVGESGSGKSTLLKLLLKYYQKYKGTITMDDTDIQEIQTEDYCKLVSSMEQDTFIFDESLLENICLYNEYTEEKVLEVIEEAGLSEIVNRLPRGIHSTLGEKGSNLSGGECQRVAFARLLLKKTPILLLDEVTSNLDNRTTFQIENLILKINNLTLVSVTHKLIKNILQKYDEIIVLKKGQIIEQGPFDELMDNKGYFFNLYSLQTIET